MCVYTCVRLKFSLFSAYLSNVNASCTDPNRSLYRAEDALAQKQSELGRHRRRHVSVREERKLLIILREFASHDGEHGTDEFTNLMQHERLPDDLTSSEDVAVRLERFEQSKLSMYLFACASVGFTLTV